MPILFNFHIFLETFYTIFRTNILIQCPVPVHVCCMFFVSQKTHTKRSPNGIKTDGDLFWNIYEFWEVESSRDGARGGHEVGGAPQGVRRAPDLRGHPVRRLGPFFRRKKANFRIEIVSKIQPNRSYGSPVIKETVKGQNLRTQKQRETERQIQSRRGSRPSHGMGAMDQRGNPSPI